MGRRICGHGLAVDGERGRRSHKRRGRIFGEDSGGAANDELGLRV